MSSSLALDHLASGKVRELYDAGEGRLLLVASDRISAFDVVLPTAIPDKGRVLTALSLHWFALTGDIVPQPRDLGARRRLPRGRARSRAAGRRCSCGGSRCCPWSASCAATWPARAGRTTGARAPSAACRCRPGCGEAERLPRRSSRPSTKATSGHDENITAEQGIELVGEALTARSSARRSRSTSARPRSALERGIILADTKFEFGIDSDGALVRRRRGADARLVALLAGRQLRAGRPRRPPSTSSTCATGWRRSRWDKTPPGARAAARGARRHAPRATARPTSGSPDGRSRATSRRGGERRVKVTVLVRPKEGILDPQGEAIRAGALDARLSGELGARAGGCSTSSSTSSDAGRGRAHRAGGRRSRARERPDRGLRGGGRRRRGRRGAARIGVDHVPRHAATTAMRGAPSSSSGARPWRSGTPTPISTAATGVIVPGGFSYGDYLRAGAIARFAPMMREVEACAAAGGPVLGICNGFQVLCEAGLLPGVLRPNHHGRFVCRDVDLSRPARRLAAGSPGPRAGDVLRIPVKHHDGAW